MSNSIVIILETRVREVLLGLNGVLKMEHKSDRAGAPKGH